MKFFDHLYQNRCLENLNETYLEFIEDLREDIKEDYKNDSLSDFFQVHLKKIIFDINLNDYSPLKFYWVFQIDRLVSAIQLIEESEEGDELAREDLFLFWEESEYTESFLSHMKENLDIVEISKKFLTLFENQILSFYYIHILNGKYSFDNPLPYNAIPEIGDFDQRLYIGENNFCFLNISDFPQLLLISKEEKNISFESDFEIFQTNIDPSESEIIIKNKKYYIRPSSKKGIELKKEHCLKIKDALLFLNKNTPKLGQLIEKFTHTIIPIETSGIVSFSLETLPGFSSINLFERDFIDLIDDLVHETGHHILNSILHREELIIEDNEKIYFSPWRKSLRPIRGLYHAVFTFYWAYYLFREINNNSIDELSEEQQAKCLFRLLEESAMLDFTRPLIKLAYQKRKITKEGMDVINNIFNDITHSQKELDIQLEKLFKKDSTLSNEYIELKELLENKKNEYYSDLI